MHTHESKVTDLSECVLVVRERTLPLPVLRWMLETVKLPVMVSVVAVRRGPLSSVMSLIVVEVALNAPVPNLMMEEDV